MSESSSTLPTVADIDKAQALIDELKLMHPDIKWAVYPLGDYDQYAEIDAPEWLVSYGNEEQDLDDGLVDPYSTMLGEAGEPAAWGISEKAAQLIQAHNKVFMAKYPNCDGPRYLATLTKR
ncbi:hypothetical protein [Pseudomonas sp. UMAB-40]|uniref:hypothetical protein n=1 Tax=Pseudomonas sp. UMAB-40 TaxID=1365407 RepID=UPI001C589D26|nr:hypothetical protein [Pseudomonas sp. UMAB-40]